MFYKTINVNELDDILQKHFKSQQIYIEYVATADLNHQHRSTKNKVGIGGVCDITFSSSRKLKGSYEEAEKS